MTSLLVIKQHVGLIPLLDFLRVEVKALCEEKSVVIEDSDGQFDGLGLEFQRLPSSLDESDDQLLPMHMLPVAQPFSQCQLLTSHFLHFFLAISLQRRGRSGCWSFFKIKAEHSVDVSLHVGFALHAYVIFYDIKIEAVQLERRTCSLQM